MRQTMLLDAVNQGGSGQWPTAPAVTTTDDRRDFDQMVAALMPVPQQRPRAVVRRADRSRRAGQGPVPGVPARRVVPRRRARAPGAVGRVGRRGVRGGRGRRHEAWPRTSAQGRLRGVARTTARAGQRPAPLADRPAAVPTPSTRQAGAPALRMHRPSAQPGDEVGQGDLEAGADGRRAPAVEMGDHLPGGEGAAQRGEHRLLDRSTGRRHRRELRRHRRPPRVGVRPVQVEAPQARRPARTHHRPDQDVRLPHDDRQVGDLGRHHQPRPCGVGHAVLDGDHHVGPGARRGRGPHVGGEVAEQASSGRGPGWSRRPGP